MSNPSGQAAHAAPAIRSTIHLLFDTAAADAGGGANAAAASPAGQAAAAVPAAAFDSQGAATIAAGAAFHVGASGQITSAHFQLQTQGISSELAAKLVARLAATQRPTARATAQPAATGTPGQQVRERIDSAIETLYQETRSKVADSPTVTSFCLNALKQSRGLSLSARTAADLAKAESYNALVRSKLERSTTAMALAQSRHVAGIVAWTIGAFVVALPLAALPWIAPGGTLGALRIPPGLLPLIGALGWGTLGGVASTLYHLPWFVQLREYDAAYLLDYLSRPPKGFLTGGALFVALNLGVSVFSLSILPAGTQAGSPLIFLGAVVAGFHQDQLARLAAAALQAVRPWFARAASNTGS